MDREQAKREIKSRFAEYLRPAKKRGTYICPLCGNGSGSSGDGMTVDPKGDRTHLKCFKCGFYGDLIELYQQEHGCTQQEAFTGLYQQYGLEIDAAGGPTSDFKGMGHIQTPTEPKTPQEAAQEAQEVQEVYNYLDYYREIRANLTTPEALAYLNKRGISYETAARYWLGYDPAWRSPKAVREGRNPPASPRIIIPTCNTSYVARDTRATLTDSEKRFAKMKEGAAQLFNLAALRNDAGKPVFVVEGEFDALSIIEVGGEALALGSTSNIKKLVYALQEKRTDSTLVLCLDNDDAGRKATKELADNLQALNISYVTADICKGYKDPNDALKADRGAFTDAIAEAEHRTAARPDTVNTYLSRLMAGEIERFKQGASRRTGFNNLDAAAGGIYPGLYVLGAISSLGKTTFIHQLADQMAAAGEEVLFFSLEQSRLEMVSKSLARITAQMNINAAVNSLKIRGGYTDDAVLDAIDEYRAKIGDRMSIIEGNFACTVSFIGQYVKQYIERTGVKPVVIVDYLQIIQGDEKRQSTKELIDSNVTELKRISRNNDVPVFVISSLNRSNYLTPVDFESFKESGGIEYTCDVLWGLQLQAINEDIFNSDKKLKEKRERIKEAKAEIPRKIELVCLKNRYGPSSYSVAFDYYPQYDLYRPAELEEVAPARRL